MTQGRKPVWAFLMGVMLLGAEAILTSFSLWLAAAALFPLSTLFALVCWGEQQRASHITALGAKWQRRLASHLPVLTVLAGQLKETAGQVEKAVAQVCESFYEIGARVREATGGQSRDLEEDISQAVVALQFQDIVNQRIAHVVETLNEVEMALALCLRELPHVWQGIDSKLDGHWASRLERGYTMEAERSLLARHNGAAKTSVLDGQGSNVELF